MYSSNKISHSVYQKKKKNLSKSSPLSLSLSLSQKKKMVRVVSKLQQKTAHMEEITPPLLTYRQVFFFTLQSTLT